MKRLASLVVFLVVLLCCTNIPSEIDICAHAQPLTVARPAPRLLLSANYLNRLKARAAANDPSWTALKSRCDSYTTGTVYPPSGNQYPSFPSIGSGYQGEEYLPAIMSLGLCYQVGGLASHGTKGAELLNAMATPTASGGVNPATDSGYGIRNYGVGMAFGYDWLYPALNQATKDSVVNALNSWISWYDQSGFIRNHPIGNYFAGYWLAKVAGAIATEGDNSQAVTQLTDVETRMWGTLVKPYFQRDMIGGGWPEGWQYGPRAAGNMVLGLWALKTAKNVEWWSEVPQARDQAMYLAYFTWPSRTRIDDQGTIRSGFTPSPSSYLAAVTATALGELGDSYAPQARAFSQELGAPSQLWEKFAFYDQGQSTTSYKGSLSYLASGPEHVAMRSTWNNDAVWASFSAGTYINAGDSGEQMFNQGSLSIVAGGTPLLVNATGQIPQLAGSAGENFVYTDSWGGGGRKLYNVFYTNNSANTYNPGQGSTGPTSASTHIEAYEDGGSYVRAKGAQLEQMYRGNVITSWSRDVVFVRPNTFVISDKTVVPSGSADQWLAWHFNGAPAKISPILPLGVTVSDVSLPGGVTRREYHHTGASQQWLTHISANNSSVEQISSTDVVGVAAKDGSNAVVVFGPSGPISQAHYSYTQTAPSQHVLADVATSSSGYTASVVVSGSQMAVTVVPNGPLQRTPGGNLCFNVSSTGAVTSCSGVVVPPPPPPPVDAGVDSGPAPVDAGQDSGQPIQQDAGQPADSGTDAGAGIDPNAIYDGGICLKIIPRYGP